MLVVTTLTVLIFAVLKGIFFFTQQYDWGPLSALAQPIGRVVAAVYENTQFLSWVWTCAPTPNPIVLNSASNYMFVGLLALILLARLLVDSGRKLRARIARQQNNVEAEGWRREMRGSGGTYRGRSESPVEISIQLD